MSMYKVQPPPPPFPGGSIAGARSDIWIPGAALSSCVRCVLIRDTRGVRMNDAQRYNHFPANPMCSIMWHLHGDCELLDPGCPAVSESPRSALDTLVFGGPSDIPAITGNSGPVHTVTLLMMPDAFSQMTGTNLIPYTNQFVPAREVLDASWLAMCDAVRAARDDAGRIDAIESFLLRKWRQEAQSPSRIYWDWVRELAVRAASSGRGRSLRQLERRVKQWTGKTLRELHGFSQTERVFFDALIEETSNGASWAELATDNGFSDQSHLTRQCRRVTGFPPAELRRLIHEDEAFWTYRLWWLTQCG